MLCAPSVADEIPRVLGQARNSNPFWARPRIEDVDMDSLTESCGKGPAVERQGALVDAVSPPVEQRLSRRWGWLRDRWLSGGRLGARRARRCVVCLRLGATVGRKQRQGESPGAAQ